jgi:hypothetical protein
LIDRIIQIDSKHCQNHDQYFVFEENIHDVLLLWTRDAWIPKRLIEMGYQIKNGDDLNPIAPIWGISLYTMPLCYVFDDPGEIYFVFRQLYTRYFYKLHSISEKQESILHLCVLFEDILKQRDSELFYYITTELDINPIEIVFKWILYAFVGILEVDQVLLMWDRIIAYDSLDVLSLTAAALISFRRDIILQCSTTDQVFVIYV